MFQDSIVGKRCRAFFRNGQNATAKSAKEDAKREDEMYFDQI
jgi:hypothetical protein